MIAQFISLAEASERWPEALVAFDWQCTHLHASHSLRFHVANGKLRVYTGASLRFQENGATPRGRAYWQPDVGVWSRCIKHLPSQPQFSAWREPYLLPHVLEYCEAPKYFLHEYVDISVVQHSIDDSIMQALMTTGKVPYTDDAIPVLQHAWEAAATPERLAAAAAQMTPGNLAAFEQVLLAHIEESQP